MASREVQRELTWLNGCDCAHLTDETQETQKGRVSFQNHLLGVSKAVSRAICSLSHSVSKLGLSIVISSVNFPLVHCALAAITFWLSLPQGFALAVLFVYLYPHAVYFTPVTFLFSCV